jgi:hypothetical protein
MTKGEMIAVVNGYIRDAEAQGDGWDGVVAELYKLKRDVARLIDSAERARRGERSLLDTLAPGGTGCSDV